MEKADQERIRKEEKERIMRIDESTKKEINSSPVALWSIIMSCVVVFQFFKNGFSPDNALTNIVMTIVIIAFPIFSWGLRSRQKKHARERREKHNLPPI